MMCLASASLQVVKRHFAAPVTIAPPELAVKIVRTFNFAISVALGSEKRRNFFEADDTKDLSSDIKVILGRRRVPA